MAGFCTECGSPLDAAGFCPSGHNTNTNESAFSPRVSVCDADFHKQENLPDTESHSLHIITTRAARSAARKYFEPITWLVGGFGRLVPGVYHELSPDSVQPIDRPACSSVFNTFDRPAISGLGPLPKASSTRSRLIGSGIEFLVYQVIMAGFMVIYSGRAGAREILIAAILFGMLGFRDINSGALSVGKRIYRVRVVDRRTAMPLSNRQALLRNIYYLTLVVFLPLPLLNVLCFSIFALLIFIDLLMILASPEGRRLGDLLAGTQVVQEKWK